MVDFNRFCDGCIHVNTQVCDNCKKFKYFSSTYYYDECKKLEKENEELRNDCFHLARFILTQTGYGKDEIIHLVLDKNQIIWNCPNKGDIRG